MARSVFPCLDPLSCEHPSVEMVDQRSAIFWGGGAGDQIMIVAILMIPALMAFKVGMEVNPFEKGGNLD